MSEKSVTVLLFPFINKSHKELVECIVLPDLPLWKSQKLNKSVLIFLLVLCGGHDTAHVSMQYPYPLDGTTKQSLQAHILTESEEQAKKFKDLMELLEQKDLEIAALKAKV